MCTSIRTMSFGKTHSGQEITLYTLYSPHVEVDITNYGASVVAIRCPDKYNQMDDIVAGFPDVEGYRSDGNYMGAVIGRVCSGITRGKFRLNDEEYTLSRNHGTHSRHGGDEGFNKKIWRGEVKGNNSVKFHYISQDGEEGYPGNLDVCVKYSLKGTELEIQFYASTDKDTIVNLTNNTFFNLSGHEDWGGLKKHRITVFSEQYLPNGTHSIPNGEIRSVENTVFDLRKPQFLISERLRNVSNDGTHGYDHCFCLARKAGRKLAARVEHKSSGRIMSVETTQPGLQLHTANRFDGIPGKYGVVYDRHSCFALQTQNWPDAINKVDVFPDMILRAGRKYTHGTWMRFSHTA